MRDNYTEGEIKQIVAEARQGGSLETLHCPRDHTVFRVFFSQFRSDVTSPRSKVSSATTGET